MSYKVDKQVLVQTSALPAAQSISTSYVEVTGSKAQIDLKKTSSWLYKFSFYTFSTDTGALFLHAQLESSNDDFSSDVQTISGAQRNLAGDTNQSLDKYYQVHTVMFIVTDLDRDYLRLRVRSYSASTECDLHRSTSFDGSTSADVCYNPSLLIMEL